MGQEESEDDSATRVFVSGLPPSLTSDQLRVHFATKFQVNDAHVIPDRRIGFVGVNNHDAAKNATKYFNKSFLRMSKIKVELAKPVEIRNDNSRQKLTNSEGPDQLRPFQSPKRKRGIHDDGEQLRTRSSASPSSNEQSTAKERIQHETNGSPAAKHSSHSFVSRNGLEDNERDRDDVGSPSRPPESMDNPDPILQNRASDMDWLRGKTSRVLDLVKPEDIAMPVDQSAENSVIAATKPEAPEEASETMATSKKSEEVAYKPKLENARLFVRNLPFDTSEEALKTLFSPFGKISEIHVVRDTSTSRGKGLGFIQYVESEHANAALQQLDSKSFQGRLLHVLPASDKKVQKLNAFEISKLPLKKQRAIQRKDDTSTFSWNSLYMNPDSVLASVAERLGVSKAEILDPTSSNSAVKQAQAETSVIEETKKSLRSNGVNVEAFKNSKRDERVLLLKNFGFGTTLEELVDMLSPFGKIEKFVFPSTGTMAIARYEDPQSTRKALKSLAYRNLKGTPLYLEKAPEKLFELTGSNSTGDEVSKEIDNQKEELSNSVGGSFPVFVRNLNFATNSTRFAGTFRPLSGFLSAKVKTRTDPKRPGEILSMGFGFVEFRTQSQAEAAVKTMNGHILDDHVLQVQISRKSIDAAEERRREDNMKRQDGPKTKIIIKNLPFEASKKDIRALFGPYGQLRSVRMPKKFNNSSRGFAFADFVTTKEAENAIEALSNTHLLGRRLVLDFAEAENVDPEEQIKAMEKKAGRQAYLKDINKIMTGSTRQKFDIDGQGDEQ